MENYLARLRENLERLSNNKEQLHIVIGNEACDLDSAVSSLVFAYFLHWKEKQNPPATPVSYVPLLNIPRSEYRLKTEVRYVLSEIFGNEVENWLLFIDEVRLEPFLEEQRLSITVVDHNKLSSPALKRFGNVVCRVIDHHVDNEPEHLSYRKQCPGEEDGFSKYVTATVGSCSTLIAERIISFCAGVPSEPILDDKLSKLLLSAILIDTSDLKDSIKTTPRDMAVAEKLEAILIIDGNYNRKRLFEAVRDAKNDVASMTVLEILAKDYKVIRRAAGAVSPPAAAGRISSIGMSTVPLSFEALTSHVSNGQPAPAPLDSEMETFRQQKQVDALVLSCVNKGPHTPKERKKQVVIYGGDDKDKDRIFSALSTIKGLNLAPASVLSDKGLHSSVRVYWQGNPGLSRKQLLPVLEDLLNGKLNETEENAATGSSFSKSEGTPSPSSPKNAGGSGGGGQPSPGDDSNQPPGQGGSAPSGNVVQGDQQKARSRGKRFLESTELARSFSVTYDDDADDFSAVGAGPSYQDDHWHNDGRAVGHLGRIDENQSSSAASYDYELDHSDHPIEYSSSYSHSTTEDEGKHYPTVSSPYATSSYDGGGAGVVANGSGNTQEESGATLSGVPDLLDSRENLADVVAGVSEDTPDLLVDYHSPSVTEAPFPVSSKRSYDDYGDVDLLQGTEAVGIAQNFGFGHTASSDSQAYDDDVPDIHVEPSFSSYPPDIAVNYQTDGQNLISPTRQMEFMRREPSESQQFQFSSDPSPAGGRSRADTPPRFEDDDDSMKNYGRKFIVGGGDGDTDLKPPGVRTPPNTFVDNYLEETVVANNTAADAGRRRSSQQSELEPELLYLKLKGTQFAVRRELTTASSSSQSAALFFPEGSVPGTPPNSFMGTPVVSAIDLASAGAEAWHSARRGSQVEPESLRERVTELSKNLPPEDVEGPENNGALIGERAFMDKESSVDSASDNAAGIAIFDGSIYDKGDYYRDRPSDLSQLLIGQFSDQLTDTLLTKALAEVFYPEVADDEGGFVNPAFGADSSTTPSPLSPAANHVPVKEDVFPDLNSAERSLPDVLSENFPSAAGSFPARHPVKTPLSAKSSSDLLSTESPRGLAFDLVSCASAASFGRESTVAHADSTEFNIGRRPGETRIVSQDPRVQMDFNDEADDGRDFTDDDGGVSENPSAEYDEHISFQTGVSGVQWEEEGYPALVDIHHDSSRLFSDEPGGFNDVSAAAGPSSHGLDSNEIDTAIIASSGPSTEAKRKRTTDDIPQNNGEQSPATESGPDSPDTESADEEPELELEEGTSTMGEKAGGDGLEWENDTPVLSPQKQSSQQWAAAADMAEERRWRMVSVNGTNHRIDMAAVEPYRRVISHGGYYGDGLNAIAVFAACYLPSRTETDYHYIMDNLFLYTVSMLDMLVADDYVIIYFQGGSTSDQMPPFSWLRKCYHMIDRRHVSHTEVGLDRRLRKNLKSIYLVHPTLWLKTVVTMTKPFISSKFSKKIYFIQALNDLGKLICMDQVEIPDEVLKYDHERVFARTYVSASTSSISRRISAARPADANDDQSGRRTSAAAAAARTSTTEGADG